jgi:transcription antitermination factor NusG
MASWYLIRSKPAREELARANLARQGYEVYPVRSTVGVANIVRFGGDYAVVPESVMDELRRRADPNTGMHSLCVAAPMAAGSPVRILGGVFTSLEGIFHRESGDDRVIVLLSVLGQRTPVEVPEELVSPLTASRSYSWTFRGARNVV